MQTKFSQLHIKGEIPNVLTGGNGTSVGKISHKISYLRAHPPLSSFQIVRLPPILRFPNATATTVHTTYNHKHCEVQIMFVVIVIVVVAVVVVVLLLVAVLLSWIPKD
jgi:hypothetical protein